MNSPPLPHNCILILPCCLSLRQTDGHKTSFLFCYIAKPRQKKKRYKPAPFPPKATVKLLVNRIREIEGNMYISLPCCGKLLTLYYKHKFTVYPLTLGYFSGEICPLAHCMVYNTIK